MMILRFVIITLFAIETVTSSTALEKKEVSAKEKIRKHQEWLQQRNNLKSKYLNNSINNLDLRKNYKTKFFDWSKTPNRTKERDFEPNSKNEVYQYSDDTESTTEIQKESLYPTTSTILTTTPSLHHSSPAFNSSVSNIEVTSTIPSIRNESLSTTIGTTKIETNSSQSFQSKTESGFESNTSVANVSEATTVPATTTENSTAAIKKPKTKKYPRWGAWSKWSECSRTCGGGVIFQQRKCIGMRSNGKRFISEDCIGLYKRYQICNDQNCPENEIEFRQKQCSAFDKVDFQGKMYEWEPYIKEDSECELNCKPIGMQYFATLNNTVIDGTKCSHPAEFYRKNYTGNAICVNGVCKAIHATGVITGAFANSGTIPCGGLICRPVSGIFIKNPLPHDYVHVATIPAGSSNISITELKNSKNLLVLRLVNSQTYAFNGDANPSQSGSYELAGSSFDYRRIDGLIDEDGNDIQGVSEWITCLGPIRQNIELLILAKEENPGIKYEYLLPITSYSDEEEEENSIENENELILKTGSDDGHPQPIKPKRKRKFQWKIIGFSQCSKSCGGGIQNPVIRCIRDSPKRFFSARRCTHLQKPTINENLLRCNTQPCPAYWRVEDWEECRCHHGEGYRKREIRCVQEIATGVVIQVNSQACMEDIPASKKRCDCSKGISRKRNQNKNRLQAHTRPPTETISMNNTTTLPTANKNAGIWLISNWNQHCSAECGIGTEFRSIFCDRSLPHSERCDLSLTPDSTRPCQNEKACDSGEWFTSPWGQCSGSCFNVTRTRQVLCIRNQLIVEDEECKSNDKPIEMQPCTFEDVEYCKPRWHYSEWTECTKTCDSGTQRRTVKCLDLDVRENTLKISVKCRYSEREPIYRSCNTHKCYEPRVDMIQNDIAPSCFDEFTNCHLVVESNLCSYEYYKQNCCYSCNSDANSI